MRIFLTLLALSFTATPAHAAEDIIGVASVTDGDTIVIHGERIRLEGIDSPETRQICNRRGEDWRCGKDASFALADMIGRKTVRCENLGRDRYKRVLGRCWLGDTDLNGWMVSQGWAVAYRYYSKEYIPQENQAKAARRGIWNSDFSMPWDFRREQRSNR